MKRLENKTAIITGSGRGIGRATALKFAQEGANLVLADIRTELAEQVATEAKQYGQKAIVVKTDITRLDETKNMVQKGLEEFGAIDILVNVAGWDKVEPFVKSQEETWDKVISINLRGTINCVRSVLDHMIERKQGKIVSVSSDAGRVGSSGEAVYSGAKGGIIAFSKTVAREMARYGINVNVVCPGPTDTPLFAEIAGYNEKIAGALEKAIPFRRLAKPGDVAPAICFFASEEADYITGQTLSVSGGLTMA